QNDNGFTWMEDVERAQRLMNRQLRISWPQSADPLRTSTQPGARPGCSVDFPSVTTGSMYQTEWGDRRDVSHSVRPGRDLSGSRSAWDAHIFQRRCHAFSGTPGPYPV